MTEAEFKNIVIKIARMRGWMVHHDLPAQTAKGRWITPTQGDAGFPDLFLVHPKHGKILAVELKSEKGRVGTAQLAWLDALNKGGIRAIIWRPSDLDHIPAWLDAHAAQKKKRAL